jgi:hypothetical protein
MIRAILMFFLTVPSSWYGNERQYQQQQKQQQKLRQ